MKKIVIFLCCLIPVLASAQQTPGYETMILSYNAGKLPDQQLLNLAIAAADKKQDSIGKQVAEAYIERVLNKSDIPALFNPDFRKFAGTYHFLFKLKDPLIQYLVKNGEISDKQFQDPGFSVRMVKYIARTQIINPVIQPGGKYTAISPNWAALYQQAKAQTNADISNRLIIESKIDWYQARQDWENVAKYNIEKIDTYGLDTIGIARSYVNNMIFEVIFRYSTDQAKLAKGVSYIQRLLKTDPKQDSWLDTHANLLYKMGKKQEAIQQEETALAIAKERKDQGRIKEYQEVLDKMRSNLPTWK